MQFPPEFDTHVRIMGGGGQVQWIVLYRGVAIYESDSNSFFMPSCVLCTKKYVVQQKGYNLRIPWVAIDRHPYCVCELLTAKHLDFPEAYADSTMRVQSALVNTHATKGEPISPSFTLFLFISNCSGAIVCTT
jgi:hypothetical protein